MTEHKQAGAQAFYQAAKAALEQDAQREEFLSDMLVTAIESGPVGYWMNVTNYDPDNIKVTLYDAERAPDEPDTLYRVDAQTLEQGFATIRNKAALGQDLTQTEIYLLQADLQNDAGTPDAIAAVALLEIAIFGEVRYC